MSDYLINLALRGAGISAFVSPEAPSQPWGETGGPELGLEILSQEDTTPPLSIPDAKVPSTEVHSTEPALPSPVEQRPGAAARETLAPVPPPHAPAIAPEPIRESHNVRHEVVREVAQVPLIEVHETIRERETVRERVIERETRPNPSRAIEKAAAPPPPFRSDAPTVEVHPAPSGVLREVVREIPAPSPERKLPPAHPRVAMATPEVPTVQPPPFEERPTSAAKASPLEERADKATPEHRHKDPEAPKPSQGTPAIAPIEIHVTKANEPRLQPARAPEAPRGPLEKTQKRQSPVEVRIGTLEIRTSAPAPRAPEPAAAVETPVEGFDAYQSVRRYSAWFRE